MDMESRMKVMKELHTAKRRTSVQTVTASPCYNNIQLPSSHMFYAGRSFGGHIEDSVRSCLRASF